jgi:hypothetical protein
LACRNCKLIIQIPLLWLILDLSDHLLIKNWLDVPPKKVFWSVEFQFDGLHRDRLDSHDAIAFLI